MLKQLLRTAVERLIGKKFVNIVCGVTQIPRYMSEGAACFDFCAAEQCLIESGKVTNVKTGVKCAVPTGWCMLVFSRSSLGQNGLIIPNSVGVIDSDYRGEIMVPLTAVCNEGKAINKGQRIAQGLLVRVTRTTFVPVDVLPQTKRGDGGFGSTGAR